MICFWFLTKGEFLTIIQGTLEILDIFCMESKSAVKNEMEIFS